MSKLAHSNQETMDQIERNTDDGDGYRPAPQMFDLGDGLAVNFAPGGRFHGWLFRKHPDGQYVSVRKLDVITPPHDPIF